MPHVLSRTTSTNKARNEYHQTNVYEFILFGRRKILVEMQQKKYLPANYLCGRPAWEIKGAYAASLSTANRWAFWNSFRTAWKSLASFASAIFLVACKSIWDHDHNCKKKRPTVIHMEKQNSPDDRGIGMGKKKTYRSWYEICLKCMMIISKLATIFFDTWNATMPEEKYAVTMKEFLQLPTYIKSSYYFMQN